MLTKIRRRFGQEEGFTLIELLVVILIIGILAAVAIPTFLAQSGKAKGSNVESLLKNSELEVQTYYADNNGSVPSTGFNVGSFDTGLSQASVSDALSYSSVAGPDSYALTATDSGDSETYTLSYANGNETHLCTSSNTLCPTGSW